MTLPLLGFLLPGLFVAQAARTSGHGRAGRARGRNRDRRPTDEFAAGSARSRPTRSCSTATARACACRSRQCNRSIGSGDSVWNGAAIGAALGGGSAIAAMARACSNANCSDTSANLDPRMTLLGALIGAGVGALIDASIDGRKAIYRAGSGRARRPVSPSTADRLAGNDIRSRRPCGLLRRRGLPRERRNRWRRCGRAARTTIRAADRVRPPEAQTGFRGRSASRYRSEWRPVHRNGTARDREGSDLFPGRQGDQPYAGSARASSTRTVSPRSPPTSRRPGGIVAAGPFEVFRYHSSELSPRVRRRLRRARHRRGSPSSATSRST